MPSQSFSTAPWLARKTSELLSRPSMCTVQSSPGCDLGVPVAPSVLYSLSLLSASGASTMPSMSGESKVSSSSAGAGSSSSPECNQFFCSIIGRCFLLRLVGDERWPLLIAPCWAGNRVAVQIIESLPALRVLGGVLRAALNLMAALSDTMFTSLFANESLKKI